VPRSQAPGGLCEQSSPASRACVCVCVRVRAWKKEGGIKKIIIIKKGQHRGLCPEVRHRSSKPWNASHAPTKPGLVPLELPGLASSVDPAFRDLFKS